MRSGRVGKTKRQLGNGNYGLGIVDDFLVQTRKIRPISRHFHLLRDHFRDGSGRHCTKLGIKNLKVCAKLLASS